MRCWLTSLSMGILLAVAAASTAFPVRVAAAEKHAEAGNQDPLSGEQPAHAEGPITFESDLAVWSLITFVVFLFVLKKFAWGPLIEGLDKREVGVLENIAAAEAARIKAEKMLAEHAAKLEKVQDEVREIIAEARRDAEHTKNDIMATAQKEAEATRVRAVQDIERARDQALDELFDHMGRSVRKATETVIGRSLTGADNDRLIEEALSGFARRKH
jgi:F-type H+-transporting ATPase subunit b